MTHANTRPNGRWRYVVPNFLTATNLTFGTISCFYSVHGNPYVAAWLILLACLFDRFDGAAARALRASGRFGIEFDSLADLVSFGMAPALLVFSALSPLPAFASGGSKMLLYAACGFYPLATAFRLARFNVDASTDATMVYFGLPCPHAAGLVAAAFLTVMKYTPAMAYDPWLYDPPLLGTLSMGPALLHAQAIFVAALAIGMISPLKVPKLRLVGRRWQDIYVLVNLGIVYLAVPLRVLPEWPLILGLQYVIVSVIYHLFYASAREAEKRPIWDAMAMPGIGDAPRDGEEPDETEPDREEALS